MRDAAAKQPIALQNSSAITITVMMIAPVLEPVAYMNIRMKMGIVVEVSSSKFMMSGALKRTETSIPSARQPLIPRLRSMDRATSVLAFLTSSDIYYS